MKNVLFYYGWLNSFNSARNGWNNDLVAEEIAHHYDIIILGNGIQDSTHGDYINTTAITAKLRQAKSEIMIFGYVDSVLPFASFQTQVDQCDALKFHGIFMDRAGYDFSVNRADMNAKVDYVHSKQFSNTAFPNAWKLNHILGTYNDPSFPNSTFNPGNLPHSFTRGDYVLLESFGIYPNSVSGNPSVFEGAAQTFNRGMIAWKKRMEYGVKLISASMIGNSDPSGQLKFDYLNKTAVDYDLDGFGSSDYNYGAGAAVKFWDRNFS